MMRSGRLSAHIMLGYRKIVWEEFVSDSAEAVGLNE
jgi:hypothetical protein